MVESVIRIDEIVIFNYLQKEQIKNIVDLELAKVEKRLANKEIKIEISDKAKELLVKEGFDQNLGARPLKRVIQKLILDPLSVKIVSSEITEGSRIFIDADKDKIIFGESRQMPKMSERPKLARSKK